LPFDVLRIPSPCCCSRGEGLKISPQVSPACPELVYPEALEGPKGAMSKGCPADSAIVALATTAGKGALLTTSLRSAG
jgi:hypothetical protein